MKDNLRIVFELRPLVDVAPWGDPEKGLKLHWFGLTDGWYDVVIGQHRLYSVLGETRGIDYQCVRLWEDLIEVAPYALEAVPEPLASRLADIDAWTAWVEKSWELDDQEEFSAALEWWFQRQMSASHLVGAPTLQIWRRDDELHLSWKSVPQESDVPTWSSPNGRATTNANAFQKELTKFDRELMSAMITRINEVEQNWSRPEIAIDVEALRREQADRSTWLQRALHKPRGVPSWDEVMEAVIALENRIGAP